jgi:hypothetical protein
MSATKTFAAFEENVTFLLRFRWFLCFALAAVILWVGLLAQKFTEFEEASYFTHDRLFASDTLLFTDVSRLQKLSDDLYRKQLDTKAILQNLSETVYDNSANFTLAVDELRDEQQVHDLYTETTFGELHNRLSADEALAEVKLNLVAKALELRIIMTEDSLLEAQTILAEYRMNFDEITRVLSSFHRASEKNGLAQPPEAAYSFCGDDNTVCSTWTKKEEQ